MAPFLLFGLLFLLLIPAAADAEVGFLQAVPGTNRPTCASIPSPKAGQTWCADATNTPGSFTWKVWNGAAYVTTSGSSALAGPLNAIQFNNGGLPGGNAGFLFGPAFTLPISPVANPGSGDLGVFNLQATTINTSHPQFLANFGVNATQGSADIVSLYSGIDKTGGSGDIWAVNTVTTQEAASGSYNAQGYELDFNNFNADRGDTDGGAGLAAPVSYGFQISGVGTKRSTSAILITGPVTPIWNRGIVITASISSTGSAFQDLSNGDKSIDIRGQPNFAIFQDFAGSVNAFSGPVVAGKNHLGAFDPVLGFTVYGISGTNAGQAIIRDTAPEAIGVGGRISFGFRFDSGSDIYADSAEIAGVKENGVDGDSGGALVFYTAPNNLNNTERGRFHSTGGLGLTGQTFVQLGTPVNGTIKYCSDCDPTATMLTCTHAGSQTGAYAFRLNGAWGCIGL